MKKLLRGACLMGVVALLATSCNKTKTDSMVYRGYSYDEQFETELANYDGEGSRAYIDATSKVMFEQGDKVMLFNIDNAQGTGSEYAMYEVEADSYQPVLNPVGSETVSDELKALGKYAFYPGDNVTTQLANQNRATFPLASTQEYREVGGAPVIDKNSLYMAAKIDNDLEAVNVFAFRNICGVLNMKFFSPSGKTVKSIAVTDREKYLYGDVTLKVNEVDPGYMMQLFRNYGATGNAELIAEYMQQAGYSVANGGQTMTLDCGAGVALGTTANDANTFYMVLRPLALRGGFDVEITFSDNTVKNISIDRDNTIKPNTYRVFPPMSVD